MTLLQCRCISFLLFLTMILQYINILTNQNTARFNQHCQDLSDFVLLRPFVTCLAGNQCKCTCLYFRNIFGNFSTRYCLAPQWASYKIRKIAGCACAGNAGNVSPRHWLHRKTLVSDPDMHHGTCVTHVPWCMSGSLTRGGGENVPGIPGACAVGILRIWQEAHVVFNENYKELDLLL